MNSFDYLRDSEQGFRLIVGSIPGLVWTMTAGGEVEFVNQQLLDYTGETREELRDWRPLMHPDDRERVMFQWTRSIQTGNAYEIEHRIRRADGVYRWFQVRGRPLRDMEGHMVRWYNLVTDIDELKKTDEKLRRSEECLLEAQRLSHTGSWQHDVVSGMVTISPEIHQIFGSSPDEDTSNAEFWFNRLHPEDRERVLGTC
jgi:PAS domain S-box-containing protein